VQGIASLPLASLAFLAFFGTPAAARADDSGASPRWAPSIAIDGTVGLGTPLGFGGGWLEVTPVPWVTAAVGVGASSMGMQEAVGARLRAPLRNGMAVAVGGGVSAGPYETVDPLLSWFDDPWNTYTWKRAYWTDLELSFERRWAKGLELRGYFGFSGLLSHDASSCTTHDPESGNGATESPCSSTRAPTGLFQSLFPYVGFAMDYAFAL
jgi:hypothetical protein